MRGLNLTQSDNNPEPVLPSEESLEQEYQRLRAKNRKAVRKRAAILTLAALTAFGFKYRREATAWTLGNWYAIGSEVAVEKADHAVERAIANHTLVVDVRTSAEFAVSRALGARSLPLDALKSHGWPADWPTDRPVLIYCTLGERSREAAALLKQNGLQVSCIRGGIIALAQVGESLENDAGRTWRVHVGTKGRAWMLPDTFVGIRPEK